MTKRYHNSLGFSLLKRRKVEVNFEGGRITSDGGAVLLRQMDQRIGLTDSINRAIPDPRRQGACQHSQKSLLKQRIYALALGYEDLNDHTRLRQDGAVQTAVGQMQILASASTLCRLENRATDAAAFDLHEVLVDQFIASFEQSPKQLILDFDATHDLVHAIRKGVTSTGFTTTIVSCRCMSFAAPNC